MKYFRHLVAAGGRLLVAAFALFAGCTNTGPQLVFGPPVFGNTAPELTITAPNTNLNLNQGERFTINWTDRDSDSAARISFSLISLDTGFEIILVSNIEENDSLAPDQFSVATDLIPLGQYNLRGVISDSVNPPVSSFALVEGSTNRVVITIGEPGINPLNAPPRVAVIEPSFNQGVAQDDTLTVVVTPTNNPNDQVTPFDPADDTQLFVLLDLDDNPQNDDPRTPDPTEIIVLRNVTIPAGDATQQLFNIAVDLGTIPPRPDGSPYFVRATIIDPSNAPVHDYADGTIRVLRSASGVVDISQVGLTLSGVRFQGFNPGSRLGTDMISVGDFDADGIDDFLLVAKFGVPRNFGNVGEAYLIYGLDGLRFGGEINVNSVATDISGVILEGPPNRLAHLHSLPEFDPRGITSVASVPDLTGDGRPEVLFGLGLADGMYTGRDDDPGDNPDEIIFEVTLRQGLQTVMRNGNLDLTVPDDFEGVLDGYIDRNSPNASFGDEEILLFSASAMDQGDQFPFFAFPLPVTLLALPPDDVNNLEAALTLTLATSSAIADDSFSVNRLLRVATDTLTFADFGGDGMPGPTEDTDFDTDDLTFSVNFFGTAQIEVDVTDTIQGILDGEIGTLTPIWMIIMGDQVISGSIFSSEGPEELRPQLSITFGQAQPGLIENAGCFPDAIPNNKSDRVPPAPTKPPHDSTLESMGAVVFMASENRDNAGIVNDQRLEATSIAIELIGQDNPPVGLDPTDESVAPPPAGTPQPSGDVQTGADTDDAAGRTRGCRIGTGWYDYINAGGERGGANPRADYFGEHVASMPDVDNDSFPEIIVSAPRNELYFQGISDNGTCVVDTPTPADYHNCVATFYKSSIVVFPSTDYSTTPVAANPGGSQSLPSHDAGFNLGSCSADPRIGRSGPMSIRGGFEVFAESPSDFLGGAEHAGDVNLDGVPDLVCGAPLNDFGALTDAGAAYIIYGRTPVGDVRLVNLDTPGIRPPTLRIRGETVGDRIGGVQTSGLDVNGDRVDDVFFSSPDVDFGVSAGICGDLDGNGVVDANDLNLGSFNACQASFGDEVFLDDPCKPFDFDNDRDIDGEDRAVFDCLIAGFGDCCPVDNGFVGVVFGNTNLDGDRTISQVGTPNLRGVKFFGGSAGDRAGADIASAGDFNRDGFGDLLIAAPGVRFTDNNGRERMGVAYLIFGGTHLDGNQSFSLNQVGTEDLPGIVFWSPFVAGRPNEAPIDNVGLLGDINNDGFDDIGLGVTRADFVDTSLPQDPTNPGTDPNIGRRPDDGSVYIIYGNNTGSNQ